MKLSPESLCDLFMAAVLVRAGASIQPTCDSKAQASTLTVTHTSYAAFLPGRVAGTPGLSGSQMQWVDIKGLWESEEALPKNSTPRAARRAQEG